MKYSTVIPNLLAWVSLVALQPAVDAVSLGQASQSLRQPSYKHKEEPKEEKNKPAVVKVEDKARGHHSKMMEAIDRYRASICAQMKDEYGEKFKTFLACHEFMEKACRPQKDMEMDGDSEERSSGKGYCKEYFPEAEKKAKAEVEGEVFEVTAGGPSPGPAPGPGPGPAPAPAAAKEEKAPAPAPAATKASAKAAPAPAAGAPAPGPMGAPGPAPGPVPAPFIPGISGGKPYGAIAENEAYYYKKDGKDYKVRMHMDEKLGLPTQGYWGKLVEHEDMETSTDDWMREFGPKSGQGSIAEACRKHPDSPWCIRKGFGRHRSSGTSAFASVPLLIALLATSLF